jgi:hypothetical protein
MDNPKIDASGNKLWFQHDNIHRDDGPAVEYANGSNEWYLHNKCLPFDEWIDKVDMSYEDKVMMKLQYG